MVETSLPLVLDFSCSPWLLSTRILKIKQIQRNFRLDVNLRRFELKADKKEKDYRKSGLKHRPRNTWRKQCLD